MAEFTILLRDVMEIESDIGLNDYPIFDEKYRPLLNKKITDHFMMREIGAESIELFRLYISRKMNEIMPLYNQFYLSERHKFDPFQTVSLRTFTQGDTETDEDRDGTSGTGSSTGSKSRATASETPQTRLAGDGDYATAINDAVGETHIKSDAVENSKSKSKQKANSDSSTEGYQALPADLLLSFRQTFINVDVDIIKELEPFFMLVWSTSVENSREENDYGYGLGFGFGFGNAWRGI